MASAKSPRRSTRVRRRSRSKADTLTGAFTNVVGSGGSGLLTFDDGAFDVTIDYGAGTVQRGLVDQLHLDVKALRLGGLQPWANLVAGTTGSHAATNDQDIHRFFDDVGFTEFSHYSFLFS